MFLAAISKDTISQIGYLVDSSNWRPSTSTGRTPGMPETCDRLPYAIAGYGNKGSPRVRPFAATGSVRAASEDWSQPETRLPKDPLEVPVASQYHLVWFVGCLLVLQMMVDEGSK
jgi:hypothetical protein